MQIRYKTPITHETAVKMIGKVRKELAKQKCHILVSKIIDPLCAFTFTLSFFMTLIYYFNKQAGEEVLALAGRIPKYTELANFVSVKVPEMMPHGTDNPLVLWIALSVLLPVAVCFAASVLIRLVYHPKIEKPDVSADVAETAQELYRSVQKMCRQDSAKSAGRTNIIAAIVLVALSVAFAVYICSNLFETMDESHKYAAAGVAARLLLAIGLADLFGLGIVESLVAMVSGVSNRYGASSIEKDTYSYWCSVDPNENARMLRAAEVDAVAELVKASDDKYAGFAYAMMTISVGSRLAVLRYISEKEDMTFEELVQAVVPAAESEFRKDLDELKANGLVSGNRDEVTEAEHFRLTDSGRTLMSGVKTLNDWGKVHKM